MSELAQPLIDLGIENLSEVLDPIVLAKHLQGVWLGHQIGRMIEEIQVRVLRHHVAQRCTLEIGFRTENGWHTLIGKVYCKDRSDFFQMMQKVQVAGFGQLDEFSIPQPIAYLPSLQLLLQERVEGLTAEEVFISGNEAGRVAAAERCALWLARFHALAPRSERVSHPSDYLTSKRMRRCKGEIAKLNGSFAGKADRLQDLLEEAAMSLCPVEVCAGHGAYRADHVILARSRTVVFDLDTHDAADPARDLARFLVALRRLALEVGSIRSLDTAAEAFRRTYLAVGRSDAERNLPFFEAAAYLKRAKRILEQRVRNWQEKTDVMLDEGLRALEQGVGQ